MSEDAFRRSIRGFLAAAAVEPSDALAEIIGECAEMPVRSDLAFNADGISDTFGEDLERLGKGDFSATRNPIISSDTLKRLVSARAVLAGGLAEELLPLSARDPYVIRFLARAGFLQRGPSGCYYFGRAATPFHSPPTTFFEALLNLPNSVLMPRPYAENFARAMTGEAPVWEEAGSLQSTDLGPYHERLRSYYRSVLGAAKLQATPWFVNLPQAEEFYLDIRELYHTDDSDADHEVYVFSTTSGLVVKEQYTGSNDLRTSQYRRDYFEFLRTSRCRIFYQLDPYSTWCSAKGIRGSRLPLEDHQEHLASFLQMPNLELSEISFDRPDTSWRREYTIVNSRNQVAFSSRSPEVKEISEGLVAMDSFFARNNQHPWQVVRTLYDAQLTERHIIKPMGEILSTDEARFRAAETFRRWALDVKAMS